jgi:hypothetical protein
MAKREIQVKFFFTSSKANGDDFIRTITIKAENETSALNMAKIEGFKIFGNLFTENCYDWKIA